MSVREPRNGLTVTVIVPVFNNAEGIERLLTALCRQTYAHRLLEVIIIDNGSSPPLHLQPLCSLPVRLATCQTPGSYAARNAGARLASGQIIAFTDADCIPEKDWIQQAVDALLARDERTLLGGDVQFLSSPSPTAVELYQRVSGFGQENNILRSHFIATANLFCHASAFSAIGLFDESLLSGGDLEWSHRAQHLGYKLSFCRNALVLTEPRIRLAAAICQARRVTAGRLMLRKQASLEMHHVAITTSSSFSFGPLGLIMTAPGLTAIERAKVLMIGVVLKASKVVEAIRLTLGGRAERR